MKNQTMTTHQLALTGLMTAAICILGPVTLAVPISPVPISFANLAVCFSVLILGTRLSFSIIGWRIDDFRQYEQ